MMGGRGETTAVIAFGLPEQSSDAFLTVDKNCGFIGEWQSTDFANKQSVRNLPGKLQHSIHTGSLYRSPVAFVEYLLSIVRKLI